MKEKFFRMSFIVQDNATMTLETNLVKIIEAELLEVNGEPLTANQIENIIKDNLELSFSEEEIRNAINKKGKNIQSLGDKYVLKPGFKEKLNRRENFKSQIEKFSKMAIEELELNTTEAKLSQLLTEYLYYCFNTNKDSILSLISNQEVQETSFSKDEGDIKLINSFLGWKNNDKDKFVYNVVSYGYVYCTLTVKKDELLANRIFRGKKFVLDANIIFRLAGINNDSRKNTIKSFVEKSKEVGVELCYTSATLDEIKRVIVNKVKWIKSVTGNQEPLDLREYDYSENDFYSIFCDWSSKETTIYNDFVGFQRYLTNLIMDVLDQLVCIDSKNYNVTNATEFESLLISLETYKDEHGKKKQTKASLRTDVNNIMHIRNLRKKEENTNLWSTNLFFISADHNLVKWSNEIEAGVQLVVLPSVWLTIMLRFSGRTTNDYKAFCSFLELRTHQPDDSIDVYHLLQNLSEKTDSNELKKKVVKEVFEHKEEYEDYLNDSYEKVVEKAFDSVMSDREREEQAEFEKLRNQYNDKEKELQDYEIQKVADDEFKIRALVDDDCRKHFRFIKWLCKIQWPIAFVLFLVLLYMTLQALEQKGLLHQFLLHVSPEIVNGMGNILSSLGIFWAIIVIAGGFIGMFVHYMASDDRITKYKNKREKHYRKLFVEKTDI